jgi:protein-S-isoprenylcysteine O-methyltransferase Ste14
MTRSERSARNDWAVTMAPKNEQDLFKVMVFSTALAFGALLASLESLRSNATGFSFQVSFRTLGAFLVGAGVALAYWRLLFNSSSAARRTGMVIGTVLLALMGVGAFLYPLRFVSREKLPDILIGLGIAVCALSLVAGLLWSVHRYLDADSAREEQREK